MRTVKTDLIGKQSKKSGHLGSLEIPEWTCFGEKKDI